jgi:Protein of unknown function (DUF1631)
VQRLARMNLSAPVVPAALKAAAQRVKAAARDAALRCVDSLGVAALASVRTIEREEFLAAQFELNKRHSAYVMTFNEHLDDGVLRELRRLEAGSSKFNSKLGSTWQSLTLVDDREVENQVTADRIGLNLQHECEWELRELDTLMMGLLHTPSRKDAEYRNPLRPELIGKAMVTACDAVSERPEVRRLLTEHMGRSLASAMPTLYGAIVQELKSSGVRAPDMTVRGVQGPGNDPVHQAHTHTGYDTLGRPIGIGGGEAVDSGPGRFSGSASGGSGSSSASFGSSGPASTRSGVAGSGGYGVGSPGNAAAGHSSAGATIGQVDAEVMTLIRRLAMLGNLATDTQLVAAGALDVAGGPLPNLIVANREELRRTASGSLDHMVIDVVGSLFDQILADPKIAPQMARHIARLQLPVLRAALGDATFFSSRRHPVRRLVNRIASLAVAFEDFSQGPGQHFLELVRHLVDEIVGGDFDQMLLYEQTLDKLEAFVAEQAKRDVQSQSDAGNMLDNKESELLMQQRYTQQLHAALTAVPMDDFLRQFLTQVWSQALMRATQKYGAESEELKRLRAAGRELVLSVQPKGSPADRKAFLVRLPQLMRDLNDGIALIGWPLAAKKDFFAKLLPAHAASLKRESMRMLDYNLLSRQLDTILATPLPRAEDNVRGLSAIPVLEDVVVEPFTAEEAQRIGLVQESAIDWDGSVDIDLSAEEAEPEVTEHDQMFEGLPEPEPIEPTKGATLADHVQIGFSYRMHFEGSWHKVRLSHISPGRTFFVFTRGKDHQHAISMTARMLYRLCETGRLRAFENAYLIERATARARKQLSALRGGGSSSTSAASLSRH